MTAALPLAGANPQLRRSRLHPSDVLRVGSIGLRTRRVRASLSALGIAIGIAAMVGVVGISAGSQNDLLKVLDKLGTNLLTVEASSGIGGGDSKLPVDAKAMLGRIAPVQEVASVTIVDTKVLRNDAVPSDQTGGITVKAADTHLLGVLGGTVAQGRYLDQTSSQLPTVVLGSVAAERLGITRLGTSVYIGSRWYEVIGILDHFPLAQDIDRTALVGETWAQAHLGASTSPTTVYLRANPDQVAAVKDVAGATANPTSPDKVSVSRPSDAIQAKAAAKTAFTSLFLGLGAVALLVGGVGVANVMVIAVLERRSEIGLRRALGATRGHVSTQFLAEALLLSALGGIGGAILGVAITAGYDSSRGWQIVIPWTGVAGGVAAALLIGAVAGLYPATRAARLSPTEALRTV